MNSTPRDRSAQIPGAHARPRAKRGKGGSRFHVKHGRCFRGQDAAEFHSSCVLFLTVTFIFRVHPGNRDRLFHEPQNSSRLTISHKVDLCHSMKRFATRGTLWGNVLPKKTTATRKPMDFTLKPLPAPFLQLGRRALRT